MYSLTMLILEKKNNNSINNSEHLINGSYVPDTLLSMLHVLVHSTFTKIKQVLSIIIPILQIGTGRLSDLPRVTMVVMVKPRLKLRHLAPEPYA